MKINLDRIIKSFIENLLLNRLFKRIRFIIISLCLMFGLLLLPLVLHFDKKGFEIENIFIYSNYVILLLASLIFLHQINYSMNNDKKLKFMILSLVYLITMIINFILFL